MFKNELVMAGACVSHVKIICYLSEEIYASLSRSGCLEPKRVISARANFLKVLTHVCYELSLS